MSADIFISFASKDTKVAMTLCSAIERRGFSCWISARNILPGENFQVSIVQAIRQAKIMLLVFTGNSNNSQEMTKELALASQQKLIVIPLRVEDVAPSDAFAYEFATRQWIDLFADWELAIDQLCMRISNALPGETATPVPAAAAPAAIEAPAVEAAPVDPAPFAAAPVEVETHEVHVLSMFGRRADAAEAEADEVEAANDEPEAAPKSKTLGRLAIAAAILGVVVGLGATVPALMKPKPAAKPPMIAVATLRGPDAMAAPAPEVQPVAVPTSLPAADAAAATVAGTDPNATPADAAPPPPKRKPRKAKPAADTEIPY